MGELVDPRDLKSLGLERPCDFDSRWCYTMTVQELPQEYQDRIKRFDYFFVENT